MAIVSLRQILTQIANISGVMLNRCTLRCALREKLSCARQIRFELRQLGYKSAIWAIAHRLCRVVWKILHEGVRFIEQGIECDPKLRKERAGRLARALRKLGYNVQITTLNPSAA